VVVQFELDVDSQAAAQEVRDRVARLEAGFPDGVDTPQVTRFNPEDAPILSLAVSSSTRSLSEITTFADRVITSRLSVISGVGQITLVGGSKRQMLIVVDPDRLEAYGVGVALVMDAIRRENQDRAAGTLISGIDQRIVTVEGRIEDVAGFNSIIVAQSGGYPVYLSDVATVLDTGAEVTSRATYQGVPSLGMDIVKVQGANTVAVAGDLQKEIAVLNVELAPEGIELKVTRDNARAISAQVSEVQRTLIEGGILTVVIVFPVPKLLALDCYHRVDPADLGDRHIRCHLCARFHAQHHDVDGAFAFDRYPYRRCDRRTGKHHTASSYGQGSRSSRA
jgi:HAE1 family hydrophobic/amphiphilic exporter-1